MSEWEPIQALAPIWKPTKKGETITGKVIRLGQAYEQPNATIRTTKGDLTTSAHKNLSASISQVEVGDEVKITYTGKQESKKGLKYETYTVLRKRSPEAT